MQLRAIALASLAVASPAPGMPVSTFLTKIDKLAAEGPLGTVTSDAALLKKELQDDAASLRAERLAAAQQGKKPAYCPDPSGSGPSIDEIVAGLKQVPPANRDKTEVKDALRAYMAQRFPC